MERFVKPVSDGGVPYLNTDIFNILQQSNLISYSSILDDMNDVTDVTDKNNGIILTGIKNVTTGSDIKFDFTNSMIYLNGDFLEPVPFLATQSNYIVQSKFYLTTTYSEKEKRLFKVTDELIDIVEKKYFYYTDVEPNSPHIEIEIDTTVNVNLCTRYLSRIYRYYISQKDQIFMTYDKTNFGTDGKGIGDMHGFALCNGSNGTKDLSGKFLIGFDKNSNVTPPDISGITLSGTLSNYGKLGNLGGKTDVTLVEENLPSHNHSGGTGTPSNNLYHNHEIPVGSFNVFGYNSWGDYSKFLFEMVQQFDNTTLPYFGPQQKYRTSGAGRAYIVDVYEEPSLNNLFEPVKLINGDWDTSYSDRAYKTDDLDNHTHNIPPEPVNIQHNNLPPYVEIAYYQKI